MRTPRIAPILLALCITTPLAWGQPAAELTEPPATSIPGFATLDRMSTDSRLVCSLGYVRTEDLGGFGGASNGFRLDLYGQHIWAGGVGGYAAVPVAFVSGDDSDSAIGNLEVGAIYLPKAAAFPIVLRGGFVLGNAGFSDMFTNGIALYSRFTDYMTAMPDTSALRASASTMGWAGTLFFRADAGVDLPLSEPDGLDVPTIGRLNVGGGMMAGQVALMGELTTIVNLESDDGGERFIHFAAATVRGMGGTVHPSISFSLPIDEGLRDMISFVVIAGVEYSIPSK